MLTPPKIGYEQPEYRNILGHLDKMFSKSIENIKKSR